MEENKTAPQPPAPPGPDHIDPLAALKQFDWAVAGPYVEKMLGAITDALERTSRNTGRVTGSLLALIIISMTGLSALAMTLGEVDTAEKVVIALISFLGGAAMFSGTPKK